MKKSTLQGIMISCTLGLWQTMQPHSQDKTVQDMIEQANRQLTQLNPTTTMRPDLILQPSPNSLSNTNHSYHRSHSSHSSHSSHRSHSSHYSGFRS